MTPDERAFLRAIAEQPADRTARLAFADFLEEGGNPAAAARAEFVRAQCEAETVHPNSARAGELLFRTGELFAAHWLDWWAPVCTAVGLPPPYRPRGGARGWLARRLRGSGTRPGFPYGTLARDRLTVQVFGAGAGAFGALTRAAFAGGFPDSLTFRAQLYQSGGLIRRWAGASPLAALDLRGIVGRDWRAIDGPHLAGLRALGLSHGATTGLDAVAASPHLTRLDELTLNPDRSDHRWAGDQYRAFAAAGLAARVGRLSVVVGGPAEAKALAAAPLGNVTALTVDAPPVVTHPEEVPRTCGAAAELLSSAALDRVAELTLGPAVAAALLAIRGPLPARLRRLDVSHAAILGRVFPLPADDVFDALDDLTLVVDGWPAEWVAELAERACVGRLRHLRLGGSLPPSEAAVAALMRLAAALDPDRLETLRVGARVCNAEPVRAALAARFGARVRFG